MQGKPPGGLFLRADSLGPGQRRRPGPRAFRQAVQQHRIGDNFLPGVGRIEDMLRVLLGQPRQLGVDFLQALFSRLRQIRAVFPEIRQRLIQQPPRHRFQFLCLRRRGVIFQHRPQPGIQRDAGGKRRHLRQQLPVNFAKLRRIADRVQMLHLAPGMVQLAGRRLQPKHGVFKRHFLRDLRAHGLDFFRRVFQRQLDVGLHRVEAVFAPTNEKVLG